MQKSKVSKQSANWRIFGASKITAQNSKLTNAGKLIKDRLSEFNDELDIVCRKAGRKKEEIKINYATKYLRREEFVTFIHIASDFDIVPIMIGENRVQDASEKIEYVKETNSDLVRYFSPLLIGNLQKNKINKAIQIFDQIHSVDSLELAEELDKRLKKHSDSGQACLRRQARMTGLTMPIFLEVNVSGEESKHGFSPEDFPHILKSLKLLRSLKIEGLMTMAPYSDDPEDARPVFRKLRKLADEYGLKTSMGMSNDWQAAIEEGTDMIRIGSKIFK